MFYTKKDMCFVHYRWDTEYPEGLNNPRKPSRKLFDPFNGHQVLFLINYYLSVAESVSVKEAQSLENIIAHQLPEELKSEQSVFNWMVKKSGCEL